MAWLWVASDRRSPGSRPYRPIYRPTYRLPGQPPYQPHPDGAGTPIDLEGTVLFAERLGRGRIGLDCLVRRRRTPMRPAPPASPAALAPVHVRAAGATLFWDTASLSEVALRWIHDGEQVGVDIAGTVEHPRIRISHGESFLVMDVVDSAGAIGPAARAGARPLPGD